jgi:hypothetical protein
LTLAIWPPYEAFYIEAMLFNSTSVLESSKLVGQWIDLFEKSERENLPYPPQQVILDALQNLVNHAAALSRYFWPSRDKDIHKDRSVHLQRRFGVDDNSPLKSRDLRDSIEHFDERLDRYVASGITGHIVPFFVGRTPEDSQVPLHIFRAYYLDTGIFVVLGKQFNIRPILDEVERIHVLLHRCSKSG